MFEKQVISAGTRYCAVYGHPVKHSASPAMQNAGLRQLGLDWRYLAFDVHPAELGAAIAGAKAMKFIGLNLTVPHKLLALDLVDDLDESARRWGAVNTIRFEGREGEGDWKPLGQMEAESAVQVRSVGFNTDAEGIVLAVREDLGLDLRGKTVLLLGAGGAGRVAALRLAAEGLKKIALVNRTKSKAEEAGEEIRRRCPGVEVELGYPEHPVDLLLNATSLGLKESDAAALDREQFPVGRAGAVYDMIYRPAETALLREAKAAGCRVSNGLGMLLYQGVKALEIWTGQRAPAREMREALEKEIYV